MKKVLFVIIGFLTSLTTNAQLNGTGDGFNLDYTDPKSECTLYSAPTWGGIMAWGGNFVQQTNALINLTDGLQLTTLNSIDVKPLPTWFKLPAIIGSGSSANCSDLNSSNQQLDMSSNNNFSIELSANINNAEFEIFIGGTGQWSPTTSTFTDGNNGYMPIKVTLPTAGVRYSFNLNLDSIGGAIWQNWAGKNSVQSIGYTSKTANAKFNIYRVGLGNYSPFCSTITTSDTITFITSDSKYQIINEEIVLKKTTKTLVNGCDSIHNRYYKTLYTNNATCLKSVQDTLNIYLSSLVSVVFEKINASATIQIYPNPASNSLSISIDNLAIIPGATIKILNALSIEIHNEQLISTTQNIDVSTWSQGVYFLQLFNGNNLIETRKIVVKN